MTPAVAARLIHGRVSSYPLIFLPSLLFVSILKSPFRRRRFASWIAMTRLSGKGVEDLRDPSKAIHGGPPYDWQAGKFSVVALCPPRLFPIFSPSYLLMLSHRLPSRSHTVTLLLVVSSAHSLRFYCQRALRARRLHALFQAHVSDRSFLASETQLLKRLLASESLFHWA